MDMEQIRQQIEMIESHIQRIREVLDSFAPAFPAVAQLKVTEKICLSCGEPLLSRQTKPQRGLHSHCYRKIKRKIDKGLITEADAIAAGKLAPNQPGGRPPDNTVVDVIQQMKKAIQTPETKPARKKKATRKGLA